MNTPQAELTKFLAEQNADPDTVQQAYRYFLAEVTDDISAGEMKARLAAAIGDPQVVDEQLRRLAADSAAIESAALLILSSAFADSAQAEIIRGSVKDAKTKLPVIEAGILALTALYGIYLYATGGIQPTSVVTTRRPDGSLETVDVASAPPSLQALSILFQRKKADLARKASGEK
jgi:hypothetical protein